MDAKFVWLQRAPTAGSWFLNTMQSDAAADLPGGQRGQLHIARTASHKHGASHVTSPGAGHMAHAYCPVSGEVHTGLPCDNQHAQDESQTPFTPQPSYLQSEFPKQVLGNGNPGGILAEDEDQQMNYHESQKLHSSPSLESLEVSAGNVVASVMQQLHARLKTMSRREKNAKYKSEI